MKKIISIIFFLSILSCSDHRQANKNKITKEFLDILLTDQAIRKEYQNLSDSLGPHSYEAQTVLKRMQIVDSLNLVKIEEFIKSFGWPRVSKFGTKASSAAFYVIQHSDAETQAKYIDTIKNLIYKREIDEKHAAMFIDRYLLRKGEPQIYGTQIYCEKDSCYLWPLLEENKIDSIRNSVGLPSLQIYLTEMGI